jgi:membrane AbrB-like protein
MASTSPLLARVSRRSQWALLLIGSFVAMMALEYAGLPAAILLGPMLAAIVVATNGGSLRITPLPRYAAQTIVGCLIASAINPSIIATFIGKWPLFLGTVLAVVLVSALIGYVVSRMRVLPATTAIWGLCPGAASAMMLMAEAFGADARLVAFMQYLRVVLVTVAASAIVRLDHDVAAGAMPGIDWFPQVQLIPFIETLALAAIGGAIGRLSRLPVGAMLVPMGVGMLLHATGTITITLPQWLLAISYGVLGWSIGLGFTPKILSHAVRALPQTMISIIVLMLFCGGLAFVLVKAVHIDPLTAYLATSPGGMDSVAIIAASSKVDIAFVMALQTVRFAIVLLVGPSIARAVARLIGQAPTPPTARDEAAVTQIREAEGDLD